jgi:hypothetical protein
MITRTDPSALDRIATSIIATLDGASLPDHRVNLDRVPCQLHRQLCDCGILDVIASVHPSEADWRVAANELLTAMMAYFRARAVDESIDRAVHFADGFPDAVVANLRAASTEADAAQERAAARIRAIFTVLD